MIGRFKANAGLVGMTGPALDIVYGQED